MADPFKSFGDIFGSDFFGSGPTAEESIKLLQLKAKADKVDDLETRIVTVKRKSQYLIDVAYNRALDDMVSAAPAGGEEWARANRLRRVVRHADEFGKEKKA